MMRSLPPLLLVKVQFSQHFIMLGCFKNTLGNIERFQALGKSILFLLTSMVIVQAKIVFLKAVSELLKKSSKRFHFRPSGK